MDQREPYVELERLVADRGWLYLFPHFRGRHNHPLGCGSQTAQQDILDALDWVREHYPVDRDRIYLTGMSGGGRRPPRLARTFAPPSRVTGLRETAHGGAVRQAARNGPSAQSFDQRGLHSTAATSDPSFAIRSHVLGTEVGPFTNNPG